MQENIASLKKTARLAGFSYLLLAVLGFYGLMYAPSQTVVRNDAVATAGKILAGEGLFRSGIAAHLASAVTVLLLAIFFYRMFNGVNAHWARLLVVLMAVQVPIVFVLEAAKLTALLTLKGEVLKTFSPAQTQDLAFWLLKMHGSGIALLELFWGVWLIPLACLVYRSGFVPRLLGIFLLAAGIGYATDSLTTVLFPAYHFFTQKIAFACSALGELSLIVWLLARGVKSEALLLHHKTEAA